MFQKLGYDRTVPLQFNYKKVCGLWLAIIGSVIIASTIFGGSFYLNPFIFMIGYFIGFYISFFNAGVQRRLAEGPSTPFQDRMGNIGVIALFVLMFLIAGPFFPSLDWRMIWLGTLLATGIHFFLFYYVHGKSMLVIGSLGTVIAIAGMLLESVPFSYFGIADGVAKLGVGLYLLFYSKPSSQSRVHHLSA
ncbi:DUF6609 family protein [Paenibacillus sp. PDC88]|uniref:DUF6609 family protein n=1 Tax=Paenibacillus sp. PDC88 TaxID=1884375 RepID=UPI000894A5A2|nr:DUF6609 family protein [Paenibacillus sp. PDC88]SDW74321.1 hypothetical protein SAMN05518848_102887 [Paenibacillus sp. PDC88]